MTDRLSLRLPRVQLDLIAAVRTVAKKLVLVLVAGSAVPFNASEADAALYAMHVYFFYVGRTLLVHTAACLG